MTDTGGSEMSTSDASMEEEPPKKRSTKALIGWVAIGTGGAFLAGGGVTGGLALMREKKLADECRDGVCPTSKRDYAMGRELMEIRSNIIIGIGAAAAATGIVMLILSKREHADDGEEDLAGLSVVPVVSHDFSGLSLTRSF